MPRGNRYVVLGRRYLLMMLGGAVVGLASDAGAQLRPITKPNLRPKLKTPVKLPTRLTVGTVNSSSGRGLTTLPRCSVSRGD